MAESSMAVVAAGMPRGCGLSKDISGQHNGGCGKSTDDRRGLINL